MPQSAIATPLKNKLLGWRSFSIGGISAETMRKWVEARNWLGGENAIMMLRHPTFTAQSEEELVDTIILTLSDLGYDCVPETTEYLESDWLQKWSTANADRLDGGTIDVLPAEAGPHIRKQYPDQPRREILGIAMKPILIPVDDDDYLHNRLVNWVRKTLKLNPVPRIFCVHGRMGGEGGAAQRLVAVKPPFQLGQKLIYRLRRSI